MAEPAQDVPHSSLVPQYRDHIVGRDDTRQNAILIDDRQGGRVVLVAPIEYLVLMLLYSVLPQSLAPEILQLRFGPSREKASQGNGCRETPLFIDEEHRV